MSRSASKVRSFWRSVLVTVLTLGLLWLFFRHVDPQQAWRDIRGADPILLVLPSGLLGGFEGEKV